MATYTCRYCRLASEGASTSCPHCGAPVDVRARVSDSGWEEQPPIQNMARIQFGQSTCQVEGLYVPVADMRLAPEDWVFFSHHVLLWTVESLYRKPPGSTRIFSPGRSTRSSTSPFPCNNSMPG